MKRGVVFVLIGLGSLGTLVGVLTSRSSESASAVIRRPKGPVSSQEGITPTHPRAHRRVPLGQRRWLVGRTSEEPESDPWQVPPEELAEAGEHEDEEDEGDEEDDGADEDDESSLERDRELVARRIEDINRIADEEPVDPSWAPAMERRIADGLVDHAPAGATLVSATCKSTLCIAEIEFPLDGDGGTRGGINWLAAFGLPRGFFVHHEPEPGAGRRTVAYLARDGYSLPD